VQACLLALYSEVDVVITVTEASNNPFFNMVSVDDKGRACLFNAGQEIYTRRQDVPMAYNMTTFVGANNLEGWVASFEEQTVETWRRALEVNLTAVFHLSQGLAGKLAENKRGSIINMTSIYGVVGPDMSLYEGAPMGNPAV
jgi:NAD(P)-dependent dehydrogenase (short-subunit alcohol dehydrogenase family)